MKLSITELIKISRKSRKRYNNRPWKNANVVSLHLGLHIQLCSRVAHNVHTARCGQCRDDGDRPGVSGGGPGR